MPFLRHALPAHAKNHRPLACHASPAAAPLAQHGCSAGTASFQDCWHRAKLLAVSLLPQAQHAVELVQVAAQAAPLPLERQVHLHL